MTCEVLHVVHVTCEVLHVGGHPCDVCDVTHVYIITIFHG